MKIFLKSFTDGLLQLLEEFGATPVSVEIAEDRLVKKIELDENLPLVKIDSYKELFAKHDAVKFDYEFDKDNLCFACEVSPADGKNEGIVIITDKESAPEKADDKMIIPPALVKTKKPTKNTLENRALREKHIAQGLCADCGKRPPEPTLVNGRPSRYCRQCQMAKLSNADKIARGIISAPTKETATKEEVPFKQLEITVDVSNVNSRKDYWHERAERLTAQGLCVSCGKRKATPLKDGTPSKYCLSCRKRRRANDTLRRYKR